MKKNKFRKLLFGGTVLIALAAFIYQTEPMDSKSIKSGIKVWSLRSPFSTDPLQYDALAHHICFRSAYASLVTEYKLGEIQGVISDFWSPNKTLDTWTFHIRQGMVFANGDIITPKIVAESLNRAALVMKNAKSESGLLEFLNGFSSLESATKLIPGIRYDSNSILLSFIRPMPDLLTKIGFGLYAVAHPSQYDSVTGEWKDPHLLISSGPYEIADWNKESLSLKLRPSFPKDLLLGKPIHLVKFHFLPSDILDSDIIIDFDESLAVNDDYVFNGPVKSAIKYVECSSWKAAGSLCGDKQARLALRDRFYKYFKEQKGVSLIQSFFPLAIEGVRETTSSANSESSNDYFRDKRIRVSKAPDVVKSNKFVNILTSNQAFEESFKSLARDSGLKVEVVAPPSGPIVVDDIDVRFKMTAILVDSPKQDIQFMFLSAHGIQLPDETGKIKDLVRSDSFDIQAVNRMLWDQGIVWPVGHMALGVWTKKSSNFNLKKYNTVLPPLDLQWIESN